VVNYPKGRLTTKISRACNNEGKINEFIASLGGEKLLKETEEDRIIIYRHWLKGSLECLRYKV
jgi:hypothetical protein